jgi:hypothetical protein
MNLVTSWVNVNSFKKSAELEKSDEEGLLNSIGLG